MELPQLLLLCVVLVSSFWGSQKDCENDSLQFSQSNKQHGINLVVSSAFLCTWCQQRCVSYLGSVETGNLCSQKLCVLVFVCVSLVFRLKTDRWSGNKTTCKQNCVLCNGQQPMYAVSNFDQGTYRYEHTEWLQSYATVVSITFMPEPLLETFLSYHNVFIKVESYTLLCLSSALLQCSIMQNPIEPRKMWMLRVLTCLIMYKSP